MIMKIRTDLIGKRVGPFKVLAHTGFAPGGQPLYNCRCVKCKQTVIRQIYGSTRERELQSCGCINRLRSHGCSGTPEHRAWISMHHRCRNPNSVAYDDYGGRGISVCKQWATFPPFLAAVGLRPSDDHSLERRDNNKGYTPCNTCWATRAEQNRNKRSTRKLTFNGECLAIKDWSTRLHISTSTIRARLKRKLPMSEVLRSWTADAGAAEKRLNTATAKSGKSIVVPKANHHRAPDKNRYGRPPGPPKKKRTYQLSVKTIQRIEQLKDRFDSFRSAVIDAAIKAFAKNVGVK